MSDLNWKIYKLDKWALNVAYGKAGSKKPPRKTDPDITREVNWRFRLGIDISEPFVWPTVNKLVDLGNYLY
jgi:hypothetical protein